MRTVWTVALTLAAGCYTTAHDYQGSVPLVFTNATPDRVCELHLSYENVNAYGDNWLPAAGVPSGGSIEFHVKPGTYKAKWSSCHDAKDVPQTKLVAAYAGTRVHQNAFEVKLPTQLFAFIAGDNPPTSYAQVEPHHQLVRFEGHTTVISASVDPDDDR